jgi:transposase
MLVSKLLSVVQMGWRSRFRRCLVQLVSFVNSSPLTMLHLDADTKYYWYDGAVDFRKGFDGLCGVVQEFLRREVTDGGVFIFVNRRRNAIKLLKWEGDGLAIYHKQLEQGVF